MQANEKEQQTARRYLQELQVYAWLFAAIN